jgi:hypothetical protein
MKSIKALSFASIWVVLGSSLVGLPKLGFAQTGANAVCTSASACSTTTPSTAFIDASAFCGTSGCGSQDFCFVVNQALHTLPLAGGVVDARGFNPGGSTGSTYTCNGTTPYVVSSSQGGYTITTPSILLLPSGTISINTTWILPDRSRIFGEGNNPGNSSTVMGTEIAANGIPGGNPMIQMGNSSLCNDPASSGQCYGVAIANLAIFAQNNNTAIDGIWNLNSGPSSYVDHVNFERVAGTGLKIGGSAGDSGPYSNLAMSAATVCAASTACVQLGDTSGLPLSTRGIHGLTCTCTTSLGTAAIHLDSSNNTLEDIHVEGFNDGIRVGSLVPQTGKTITTAANVILNLNGGTSNADNMKNVVRVCALTANTGFSACGNADNVVSDLTMEGVSVTRSCSNGTCPPNLNYVIDDDLTATTVPYLAQLQNSVGMYVIGERLPGGRATSYAKFATSPVSGISTWGVASAPPVSGSSCQSGSLFSNTSGTASLDNTLWVCSSNKWTSLK